MRDGLAREVEVAVREVRDAADVVRAVDVRAHLDHRQVPVRLDDAREIDEREGHAPVGHGRGPRFVRRDQLACKPGARRSAQGLALKGLPIHSSSSIFICSVFRSVYDTMQ